MNNGDKTFTMVPNVFTSQQIESAAVGDLNHDGFVDVYAGYARLYNTPSSKLDKLFLNTGNGNGFLNVDLEGVESNRNAIGARLELTGPWGTQVREVRGGESYGIQHSFTAQFGMGNAAAATRLKVRWPSGKVDVIENPVANQFLRIREGATAVPAMTSVDDQINEVGQRVSLQVVASDPTNDLLEYAAANLPDGLEIDEETGRISGELGASSQGNYSVVVSVSDSYTTVSSAFRWVVEGDTPPPPGNIFVDGVLSDWSGVYTAQADPEDVNGAANRIDLKNLYVAHNETHVFVAYQNRVPVELNWGWVLLFDTDRSPTTGYQMYGVMGADFILLRDVRQSSVNSKCRPTQRGRRASHRFAGD
ncbi:MAG: ASPIC/UnbV domain-containing protein, partial [Verrucomicrobiota bacterium]